jgi:hypothetical protein
MWVQLIGVHVERVHVQRSRCIHAYGDPVVAQPAEVAISLSVQNARYLARELRGPAILMLADTSARKVYWHAIQLDTSLRRALADSTKVTITVRVSTRRALPDTVAERLDALQQIESGLASRFVTTASIRYFVDGTAARLTMWTVSSTRCRRTQRSRC